MTGVVWACLSASALFSGNIHQMWLWLGIALVVDGLDGTLARKAQVSVHASSFDGSVLDLVVDYLTWTFIPALFIYLHVPFGSHWVALAAFIIICASSVFCYCNTSMKTDDYYFMGFPAAWNVVAVIMWVVDCGPTVAIIATAIFSALTLAPVTFVHPFRVGRAMVVNIIATAGWIGCTVGMIIAHPDRPLALEIAWWVCGGWLMLLSAIRTVAELVKRWHSGQSMSSLV